MAAPFIVGKICQAEELAAKAEELLLDARSNVISLRGSDEPVAAELYMLFSDLSALRSRIGSAVKHAAALISDDK